MQPDRDRIARLAVEIIDGDSGCTEAILLLAVCEAVGRKLDASDREVMACALRTTANNLVGPELPRHQWN
jgi:hypothetical protein